MQEAAVVRERAAMRPAVAGALRRLGHEMDDLVVVAADARALAVPFATDFPDRFIDVGIAEANLMGVAGGLARTGRPVVVCGMAPFLVRRAAEQLRLDVCVPGLPVTVLGVGGGVAYGDLGASHHAPEDLATMASMPGTQVYCPADVHDARWSLARAVTSGGPAYVRLGAREDAVVHDEDDDFSPAGTLRGDADYDILVVAAGATVAPALDATRTARCEGLQAAVLDLVQVHPFPREAVQRAARRARRVVSVEEHVGASGIGAQTALALIGRWEGAFRSLAIGDGVAAPGADRDRLFAAYGIDAPAIHGAMTTNTITTGGV